MLCMRMRVKETVQNQKRGEKRKREGGAGKGRDKENCFPEAGGGKIKSSLMKDKNQAAKNDVSLRWVEEPEVHLGRKETTRERKTGQHVCT